VQVALALALQPDEAGLAGQVAGVAAAGVLDAGPVHAHGGAALVGVRRAGIDLVDQRQARAQLALGAAGADAFADLPARVHGQDAGAAALAARAVPDSARLYAKRRARRYRSLHCEPSHFKAIRVGQGFDKAT
jgi:hypothetical protein